MTAADTLGAERSTAPVTYWAGLDRFREVVRRDPHRPALRYPDGFGPDGLPQYRRLEYGELDAWAATIAQRMADAGVGAGTRTIVLVLPGPELYAILLGLLEIGAVPVVIDPGMGVRRMLRCLRAVRAEAFVGMPQAHALRVLARWNFRSVRTTVTVGKRWFWGGPTLNSWGRRPERPRVPGVHGAAEDTLLIAFTTGSTGPAKAVEMTHGNLSAMVEQVHIARDERAPEASLITLPLVGVLDLLLGSRCVIPPLVPSKVGATDPEHVVDAIRRFDVRTMFASPAVLIPLLRRLRARPQELPTLESVFSGGAPVPDWCITGLREVLREDVRIFAGYGSTEALPMSTVESRELLDGLVERAHRGEGTCLGRPAHRIEARVVAITDEPLPTWVDAERRAGELDSTGGIGELVVAGPNVSTRYHWPERANALGKIADGDRIWHRTGDLARLDGQGRIWFCGRKSQRVRTTDGELFTVQVEQIFAPVAGVARTALVGVGEPGVQRPVLCVEVDEDHPDGADQGSVLAAVRARAAEFALTRAITDVLVHPGFPVDIRHNAKIGREQLAVWAGEQLDGAR
ncbi:AMP-binding protein [Nocardia higoensis]|uniref:AMP-binding protein n=1 Tax=Nocardia higoensis TaxID=228599 RepID=A0ABS0D5D1_9NOCA|nr:fatty acid CoA ligase family protein [Nocardia higoensis]MBF6353680.1 AMP-binding protein [Nocardia higoensis]